MNSLHTIELLLVAVASEVQKQLTYLIFPIVSYAQLSFSTYLTKWWDANWLIPPHHTQGWLMVEQYEDVQVFGSWQQL